MQKIIQMSILATLLLSLLVFSLLGCASQPAPSPAPQPTSAPTQTTAAPTAQPSASAKPSVQPPPVAQGGEIVLRTISTLPGSERIMTLFNKWVDNVNTQLKGQLSIKVLGGPEVIASADQAEAVRNNVIDLSFNQSGQSSGVIPEMMFRVICKMDVKTLRDSGMWDFLNTASTQRANAYYLGTFSDNNQFWLSWNTEVKNPRTDFKGLKLRGVSTYNPGIKILGATAISIPITELYTAMDRKMVDGFGQPIVETEGQNYGKMKMIKWAAYLGLSGGQGELLLNQDVWKRIPAPIQQKITDITKTSELEVGKFWKDQLDTAWAALQQQGVKSPNWSAEDVAWFQTIWGDGILADLKTKVPADTVAKYNAIISKK